MTMAGTYSCPAPRLAVCFSAPNSVPGTQEVLDEYLLSERRNRINASYIPDQGLSLPGVRPPAPGQQAPQSQWKGPFERQRRDRVPQSRGLWLVPQLQLGPDLWDAKPTTGFWNQRWGKKAGVVVGRRKYGCEGAKEP